MLIICFTRPLNGLRVCQYPLPEWRERFLQGDAPVRQLVFHARRNFRVGRSDDHAIAFERPQGHCQHALRYAFDVAVERLEASPLVAQRREDKNCPFVSNAHQQVTQASAVPRILG